MAPWIALDDAAGPTVDTSKAAFEMAGIGPEDIDVAQLQDTEVGAEIMHMAENGFCEHGEQERMIQQGETEIGGKLPVNTDGGCLAQWRASWRFRITASTRKCSATPRSCWKTPGSQ